MSVPSVSHPSILNILAQLGALDLGAHEPRILPGDGTSLIPCWDGGNPAILVDGKLAGEAFVVDTNVSTMAEHALLRDTSTSTRARYPDSAPRLPNANAPDAVAAAASQPFNSLSAFKAGVRDHLSLASTENATYARAAARRFRVTNVSALAGSLSEATPASKKITKLVGVDGEDNPVEGWVYVEKAVTQGGDLLECQVHQLTPAGMVLAPSGTVTLEGFTNSNDWDLPAFISANAAVGMKYCRARCWISPVATTAELESAGSPSGPSTPSGVENWS